MRQARFIRTTRNALLAVWAGVGLAGCTHNHYYGAVPVACAPGTSTDVPGTVQYGSICDVPARMIGGGCTIASSVSAFAPTNVAATTATAPRASATRAASRGVISARIDGSGILPT